METAANRAMNEVALSSTMRYQLFPATSVPPGFIELLMNVLRKHETAVSTTLLGKGLTSDEFLREVQDDLEALRFQVEKGKKRGGKVSRPVLFGENGLPKVTYEIDAYHSEWEVVLEIEAGRAWMGNAVYRDLIRTSVMVGVKYLILAVPNRYKYRTSGRETVSEDYENTKNLLDTIYQQSEFKLPYQTILIGY